MACLLTLFAWLLAGAAPADAAPAPRSGAPGVPGATRAAAATTPALPSTTTAGAPVGAAPNDTKASISLDLGGVGGKPSQSLMIIVLITLLSVAPALLIMMTSFTRIVIVLSLTRNALGLHTIPPNQVIVGPGHVPQLLRDVAHLRRHQPRRHPAAAQRARRRRPRPTTRPSTRCGRSCSKQTRKGELAMFSSAANGGKRPEKPEDVGLAALIPAFILSELKTAFIIGFVIFIPFLVIDIVVSSSRSCPWG